MHSEACVHILHLDVCMRPHDDDDAMPCSATDFGVERYGGQLVADVFYPSENPIYYDTGVKPPKCIPTDAQHGCVPFAVRA